MLRLFQFVIFATLVSSYMLSNVTNEATIRQDILRHSKLNLWPLFIQPPVSWSGGDKGLQTEAELLLDGSVRCGHRWYIPQQLCPLDILERKTVSQYVHKHHDEVKSFKYGSLINLHLSEIRHLVMVFMDVLRDCLSFQNIQRTKLLRNVPAMPTPDWAIQK